MTHPRLERTYTLRVRFGGNPDELDAVVAGAATWLFQSLDLCGRHSLEVTVTDTGHGEPLARVTHTPTGAPASAPRDDVATPPPPVGSTSNPETVRIRDAAIRIFDRSPESDDASDMYALDVFGLSVLVRLRTGDPDDADTGPEPFIHIDNEGREPGPLVVEVGNSGETEYHI